MRTLQMDALFAVKYSYLIPLLPLLAAVVAGFLGARWLKGNSHWPIWIGVGASAILSLILLFGTLGLAHKSGNATAEATPAIAGHVSGAAESIKALSATKKVFTWLVAGTPGEPGYFFANFS